MQPGASEPAGSTVACVRTLKARDLMNRRKPGRGRSRELLAHRVEEWAGMDWGSAALKAALAAVYVSLLFTITFFHL